MLAVAAESVETSPLEENRLTELSVFWTLNVQSVDIPDTLNAPEILAVTAERVFDNPIRGKQVNRTNSICYIHIRKGREGGNTKGCDRQGCHRSNRGDDVGGCQRICD